MTARQTKRAAASQGSESSQQSPPMPEPRVTTPVPNVSPPNVFISRAHSPVSVADHQANSDEAEPHVHEFASASAYDDHISYFQESSTGGFNLNVSHSLFNDE
jgi:hypothetical protein